MPALEEPFGRAMRRTAYSVLWHPNKRHQRTVICYDRRQIHIPLCCGSLCLASFLTFRDKARGHMHRLSLSDMCLRHHRLCCVCRAFRTLNRHTSRTMCSIAPGCPSARIHQNDGRPPRRPVYSQPPWQTHHGVRPPSRHARAGMVSRPPCLAAFAHAFPCGKRHVTGFTSDC